MRRILILIFLFGCGQIFAQLTANALLASAWDDPALQLQREEQAYLEGHDFKLPLLRELQLRTSTRDWDPTQQELAIRLQGNTPGMKRTQASIYATMKAMSEAERLELLQTALTGRYELVVDAYFAKRSQQLLLRQQQVLMDKKAVFTERLALGLERDLDDFFRAEEAILDVEKKLYSLHAETALLGTLAFIYCGKTDTLVVDTVCLPFNLFQLTKLDLDKRPPSLKKEILKAELAEHKLEMEQKESRNLLSFLQFGYTGNANDPLNNRFRLGAGVTLPWPNSSKLQIQERELEALQAKSEAAMEENNAKEAWLRKGAELTKLAEERNFMAQQAKLFAEQYDPQRLHASGLDNPETLLRVKENLLRMEVEILAKEKDVYQAYIALLSESGLISQEPVVNWLSPNLEMIAR